MNNFELHPQLSQDSLFVTKLSLCEVRLVNDASYPWMLLVPARKDIREIHQLSPDDSGLLMQEICFVSSRLEALTGAEKMNVAALGNMVPQLHVHIIARYTSDAAWPGPIWGVQAAAPYEKNRLDTFMEEIRAALNKA